MSARPAARDIDGSARDTSIRAGILAGIAGFATFLSLHAVWIAPIWFIAPIGALVAGVGGVAVGAAYAELLPVLPRRPWSSLAVAATVAAVLAPAFVIAQLHGPVYAIGPEGRGTLVVPWTEAVAVFVVGLLATATVAGAAIGWLTARTRRAAGLTAVAALIVALGPGHNIPFLGGTPAVGKELVILGAVIAMSSLVLVGAQSGWTRRTPSDPQS